MQTVLTPAPHMIEKGAIEQKLEDAPVQLEVPLPRKGTNESLNTTSALSSDSSTNSVATSSSPRWDPACFLAYTAVVLSLLRFSEYVWPDDASSAKFWRLLKVLSVTDILLIVTGMGVLDRIQSSARGCKCFPCSCLFIPWLLIMVGLVNLGRAVYDMDEHRDGDSMDWIACIIPGIHSVLMILFGAQWIFVHRRSRQKALDEEESDSDEEESDPMRSTDSLKMSFVAAEAQDSRKYELIYIVAEAVSIAALAVYIAFFTEHIEESVKFYLQAHLAFAPFCLVMRVSRYCNKISPESIVSSLGTCLDALVFTWYGAIAGMVGTVQNLGSTTHLLNVMIAYAVITFLPFMRAIIVVPLCYTGYCSASILGGKPDIPELVLLGLALGMNLAAKKMIEKSRYEAFLLMREKEGQVLHEKVLRCQAEFKASEAPRKGHSRAHLSPQAPILHEERTCMIHKVPKGSPHAPISQTRCGSTKSGPTILPSHKHVPSSPVAKSANCLSSEALVWLEGEPIPRKVDTVQAGQRILCYDRLGGAMKHAAVSEVCELGGQVLWSTVTLADGTALKLTADHPVQPVPADAAAQGMVGPWSMSAPIKAGDLKPGADHLLVLKVCPVEVQSKEFHEETGSRVALCIHQPERHTIFVASPGQHGGYLQTMAVESSAELGRPEISMTIERTSNTVEHISMSNSPGLFLGQSHSAPPSIHPASQLVGDPNNMLEGTGSVTSLRTRSTFTSTVENSLSLPGAPMHPEPVFSVSPSLVAQSISTISRLTSDSSDCASGSVIIGGQQVPTVDKDGCAIGVQVVMNGQDSVALRSVISVQNAGWQSLGSATHGACACKPCFFQNRNQSHGKLPCSKGSLCDFCHEGHEYDLRKQKREAARNKRQAAARLDGPEDQGPSIAAGQSRDDEGRARSSSDNLSSDQ